MNRRTALLCIVFLAFVPVAAALLHDRAGGEQAATAAFDTTRRTQPASTSQPVAIPARAQDTNNASVAPLADSDLLARTEHKYRFLLADLRLDAAALQRLKQWLMERESITQALENARANDSGDSSEALSRLRARLAQIESAIRATLHPSDYTFYAALEDSDAEQQQLSEYMGGISSVAPLDERQERAILKAKLLQKQRYATVMRDAGLDRETLSPSERDYAHATVLHALEQYRNDFLLQAAPSLTEEQYTLLSDYETTEFKHELERLQQRINAK